jgi:drug/metabolite transporter (DMT)-like permease
VSSRTGTNLVLILLIALGWGLLGPASKVLFAAEPAVFDGFSVAAARAAWSFPIFLIALIVVWRREPPRLEARHWLGLGAAGLVFGIGITVLFSVAAQHTSVAHISFFLGMSPVTSTAAAAVVFRTGLSRRDWVALMLGVVGVTLLAVSHANDKAAFFGDALMVGWLIGFAVYGCCLQYVGTRVRPAMVISSVGAISMGSLLIFGLAMGWGRGIPHVADTPSAAAWFFGEVVLGSTLIAQAAYAVAVQRMGVAVATIGAEYGALAVGVSASLWVHEPWTALTVLAGLIFCSALAATFVPLPWLGPLTRSASPPGIAREDGAQ